MLADIGILIAVIATAVTGWFTAYTAATDKTTSNWVRVVELIIALSLFILTVILASFFKH
jgi:hypothetical protein